MADNKINVGGRLHSIATGNILAGANEILDDSKNKKQSVINAETDVALADRYTKEETYNKNELNNLITTPDQQYITVNNYSALPVTGSADTIYRVSNWDGSLETPEVDITKYSEYAWNGTEYVFLSVKSQVGEVFDISANHSDATYADLATALGTNGANVPSTIRKGGMSVKFIKTTPATYTVVKTEGIETQPTGTEVQEALNLNSGTYTAAQMTGVTPPESGSITYYLAVTETVDEQEVTTYITWVITKASSESSKYEQWRYMGTSTANTAFANVANWQGVDDEPTVGSNNLVKSSGVKYQIDGISKQKAYINKNAIEVRGVEWSQPFCYSLLKVKEGDVIEVYGARGSVDLYPIILFNEDKSQILPITKSLNPNVINVQDGYDYCACNFIINGFNSVCIRHNNKIYANIGLIIDNREQRIQQQTQYTINNSFTELSKIQEYQTYDLSPSQEYSGMYIDGSGQLQSNENFTVKLFDVSSFQSVYLPYFRTAGSDSIIAVGFYNLKENETPNSNNIVKNYLNNNVILGFTSINCTHIAVSSHIENLENYGVGIISLRNSRKIINDEIFESFKRTELSINGNNINPIRIFNNKYLNISGNLFNIDNFSVYVYLCSDMSIIKIDNFKKSGANILYAAFFNKNNVLPSSLIEGWNVSDSSGFIDTFEVPSDAYLFCLCSKTEYLQETKVAYISMFNQLYNSNWTGKTALFYGDSVIEIGQYGDVVHGEMDFPYDITSMGTNWQRRLCNILGIKKYYSRGIGSARWAHSRYVAYIDSTYGNLVERPYPFVLYDEAPERENCIKVHYGMSDWDRITAQIPESIRNTIDLIFMFSHNSRISSFIPDFKTENVIDAYWMNYDGNPFSGDYNTEDEANAILSTIMKLQIWCPNAIIVIGTPMSGRGQQGQDTTDLSTSIEWQTTVNFTKEITQVMSIPCINVWGNDGINPLNRTKFIADGVHPYTVNGAKALARTIACGLNNVYPKI